MNRLNLRRVPAAVAIAGREIGRGRWLDFISGEEAVRLTLGPLLPPGTSRDAHALSLTSKQGPLQLSNADALLSLCGETPVISGGPLQAWYWQLINQQLAPVLYDLLSPLQPLPVLDQPLPERIDCRISAERGGEKVQGILSCRADTLLGLLDGAFWQSSEQPVPGDWPLHCPVIVGRLQLTASELCSLREGDVLLPSESLFNIDGQGQLQLGSRQWAVSTQDLNEHLQLRLIHEEDFHDER